MNLIGHFKAGEERKKDGREEKRKKGNRRKGENTPK